MSDAPSGEARPPLRLFQGYGIEMEYMIVRRDDLSVLPVSDEVLRAACGEISSDYEEGPIAWSNELVLHVIELKTNGPSPVLAGLPALFHHDVLRIDGILAAMGGRLLPTGMHPTMDPHRETRLWPHENSPVYECYNRIFDCRGHGWSNLQSTHLNLPFGDAEEFGRLHAAIRAVLPLLPALSASSPLMDGKVTGVLDNRLQVYMQNQRRVPSISGLVVPEAVFTPDDYQERILRRIYRDVAALDPEGIIQHEFLNSRGAIARFERDAIEIRVLDIQEAPVCDIGVVLLVSETLRALVDGRLGDGERLRALDTETLSVLFRRAVVEGEQTVLEERALLDLLGVEEARLTLGELWRHLADTLLAGLPAALADARGALDVILDQGPLARRILRALGDAPDAARIRAVYQDLADRLLANEPFRP